MALSNRRKIQLRVEIIRRAHCSGDARIRHEKVTDLLQPFHNSTVGIESRFHSRDELSLRLEGLGMSAGRDGL